MDRRALPSQTFESQKPVHFRHGVPYASELCADAPITPTSGISPEVSVKLTPTWEGNSSRP